MQERQKRDEMTGQESEKLFLVWSLSSVGRKDTHRRRFICRRTDVHVVVLQSDFCWGSPSAVLLLYIYMCGIYSPQEKQKRAYRKETWLKGKEQTRAGIH